jgi:hypothetical protein
VEEEEREEEDRSIYTPSLPLISPHHMRHLEAISLSTMIMIISSKTKTQISQHNTCAVSSTNFSLASVAGKEKSAPHVSHLSIFFFKFRKSKRTTRV